MAKLIYQGINSPKYKKMLFSTNVYLEIQELTAVEKFTLAFRNVLNKHANGDSFVITNIKAFDCDFKCFDKLLLQTVVRNGRKYFALRNIAVNPMYYMEGYFSKTLEVCIDYCKDNGIPFLVDDVVSPIVERKLDLRKDFRSFYYNKKYKECSNAKILCYEYIG